MAREIDEAWIEEAIDRYQRFETLTADFERAVSGVEVTVNSPDGLVEIVVAGDGSIRDVRITESLHGRTSRELARAVKSAIIAAADAARWAREKLQQEMFGEFRPLSADFRRDR